MKKLVLFIFALISIIFITACTPKEIESANKLKAFADSFSFDTSLTNDVLNLPNTVDVDDLGEVIITFESSNLEVINELGQVTRKATDQEVTITITFRYDLVAVIRNYTVTVTKLVESTFVVSFNTNSDSIIPNQTILTGGIVIKPSDPTKEGFEFLGWYLNDELFDFNTIVKADLSLIAKWQEKAVSTQYTLSFDTNGGNTITDVIAKQNEKFVAPTNPTRTGFVFDGWYLDATLDTLFDFNTLATSNITVYAKWLPETIVDSRIIYEHNFTIDGKSSAYLTFDEINTTSSNYETYQYNDLTLTLGYKIDGQGKITFTTTESDVLLLLVMGRRKTGDGGILEGQSVVKIGSFTQSFTEQYIELEIPLHNAGTYTIERESSTSKEFGILYLGLYKNGLENNQKTVTFNTQGGSLIQPKKVEVGSLLVMPEDPTKTDIDFVGWSTQSDTFIPFDFNKAITEDITLYAHWEVLPTFEVTVDGILYEVKKGKTLPEITPTFIEGKVFLGYLLDSETFELDTPIESDLTLVSEYRDAQNYELTLDLGGGSLEGPTVFNYYEYEDIILPVISKVGGFFVGWFIDPGYTTLFTSAKLQADTTLYAKFVDENDPQAQVLSGAYFEAVYATWQDANALNAKVSYKLSTASSWVEVDQALVRQISTTTARVDVVGLKEGSYDLKIETSAQNNLLVNNIYTRRNDRSGYAHFNYTEGIGGYNDDGTLKSNAIVVYVTESNKNDITIPGIGQTGLGWILNNNQYFSGSSNTHSTQEQLASLAHFNTPIVFRIIGKVTQPEGLTVYDSTTQGGSIGDNGGMARIRNANHITIEGIGEDAEIYGWGIHFMAMTSGRGIGFEARNLTFRHYPEDAIGLEGVQNGTTLTSPVSRAWIHHVTFHEGYHPNPAESDKANGDGSLDIKRGEYFTVAYNQFLGAHKTNLVGSSDSALQFHITYHHNHWQNNASRIPLARNANIHMYNNIFETTDDNQNEASYAQNTRVNAYILSEANYFFGTKNPSRVDSGAVKSWQDVKYSTYGEDGATVVSSRNQTVSSGNRFENFDTNPAVFYYDALNQKSDVEHLTDAITARSEVMMYAGHYRAYQTPVLQKITHVSPTILNDSVSLPNTKIQKGIPLLVFQVLAPAEVELIAGSTSVPPVLVTIYGEILITGSGKIQVAPGIYVIEAAQAHGASKGQSQAKESNAGYIITLDSEAQKQARIDFARDSINALPSSMTYTTSNENLLLEALHAYDALFADEKLIVNGALLTQKEQEFNQAGKVYIENLISSIGTVDEGSLTKISTARETYNQAKLTIQNLVVNLQVLIDAETAFESFKIDGIINQINDLTSTDDIGLDAKTEILDQIELYESTKTIYDSLTEAEKLQVTNSNKLLSGLEKLYEMKAPYVMMDFIDALNLDEITRQVASEVILNHTKFNAMDMLYKALFSQTQVDKLNEAYIIADGLAGNSFKYMIDGNVNTDNYFTFNGDGPVDMSSSQNVFGYDIQFTSKLNSSATFQFTTTIPNATLIIVVRTRNIQSNGRLDIDGEIYNLDGLYGDDGLAVIEITLEVAKTYTIKRDNRELVVYYIEVIE